MFKLIKKFLLLPLGILLLQMILLVLVAPVISSCTENQLFNKIIYGSVEFVSSVVVYFLIYKIILSTTDFGFNLTDSIKAEWLQKKSILPKEKSNRNIMIVLFSSVVFLSLFSNIIRCFIFSHLEFGSKFERQSFVSSIITIFISPVLEEFIFRKIYFKYCNLNKIGHALLLNVVIFSLVHIIPYPSVIILGLLLSYSYKKYNSLIINTVLHFMFNLSSVLFFMLVKLWM